MEDTQTANPQNVEPALFFAEMRETMDLEIKKSQFPGIKAPEMTFSEKLMSKFPCFKVEETEAAVDVDEHKIALSELEKRLGIQILLDDPAQSKGLTSEEAAQRLVTNGPNVLSPRKTTPAWVKFLKQFLGFFPLLLELGGILCLIGYGLDRTTVENLYLGVILLLVVLVTAIFSFIQDAKAANVMEGFKKLAPQNCKVTRDGEMKQINASELVLGDIVHIRGGDKVPADLRLIAVSKLKVDNSSLTGESEPQARSVEMTHENPLETHNLAFFATLVQEGDGVGIVIRVGDGTILGKIANLASNVKGKTSTITKEIKRFILIISIVAIALGLIFFGVGFAVGQSVIPNVVFAIGIIVANVPEGLLPTITVAMALTAKRMAKRKVLVKNLETVETLGSCTTVASDKTGTLTQNKMTVVHLFYDGQILGTDSLISSGNFSVKNLTFQFLYRVGILCSRAVFEGEGDTGKKEISEKIPDPKQEEEMGLEMDAIEKGEGEKGKNPSQEKGKIVGDASEIAILQFLNPIFPAKISRGLFPKIFEVPFSSKTKWQFSIHKIPTPEISQKFFEEDSWVISNLPSDTFYLLVIKGAFERILPLCSTVLHEGEPVELDENSRNAVEISAEKLASVGERVMGFAYCFLDGEKFPENSIFDPEEFSENFFPKRLTFVGLMALMDPPRKTVPHAVEVCKNAGIRVIMVTGDHPATATAIAKQVGILEGETLNEIAKKEGKTWKEISPEFSDGIVIEGSQMNSLTTQDWEIILKKKNIVFARTSPEQKLEIVSACQSKGEIVAVTGDGVNDSPALVKSDLGCAMGITGSDVSKEAADIILLDDNFASIISGVQQGRIIFDNLKKCIVYSLSSNTVELLPFLAFVILQIPLALSAVLILCIDLGTDMVPAISLAYEQSESDVMKRRPRNVKTDRLVTLKLVAYAYFWLNIFQVVSAYLNYFVVFSDYGISPHELLFTSITFWRKTSPPFKGFSAAQQLEIQAEAQSAFFVGVVLVRMVVLLVCKTRKNSLFKQNFRNLVLIIGLVIEIILCAFLVYVPGVNTVFGTKPLGYKAWLIPLPFAAALLIIEELRKLWIRKYPKGLLKRITYW